MLARRSLTHGMPVRGPRGEWLGRLLGSGQTHFLLQRRPWSRERFGVAFTEVASLEPGVLRLLRGAEALRPFEEVAGDGPFQNVRPLDTRAATVAEALGAAPA